jgi:hemerythrin-like domain-containing protein
LHATVESIGSTYLELGSLSPADSQDFREAVGQLAAMYKRHIEVEDHDVFPVAARLLTQPDKQAIAGEMAARRNVKSVVALEEKAGTRGECRPEAVTQS